MHFRKEAGRHWAVLSGLKYKALTPLGAIVVWYFINLFAVALLVIDSLCTTSL